MTPKEELKMWKRKYYELERKYENKSIIVGIFQLGMSCGLNHPFEFFINYLRSLDHMNYKKVPELELKAYNAMIDFMKNTASCEEEEEYLKKLDIIKLNEMIDKWYKHEKLKCKT